MQYNTHYIKSYQSGGGICMATKSILKSVVIRDEKSAQALLDAIESSRSAQKNMKEPKVSAKRMNKKTIAKIFGTTEK